MPNMRIVPSLNKADAQSLCVDIRNTLEALERDEALAREYIKRFHECAGWIVLGYESFADCAKAEFGKSFQQAYRLLGAAHVDANLNQLSPTGESFVVPVNHARQLSKLADPQTQYNAYSEAKKLAETEGAQVTENHVATVVKQKMAEQFTSTYAIVGHMVRTGDLSIKDGVLLTKAIDRLKPSNRGYVIQLIAKWGLTNAELANALGQLNEQRTTSKEPSSILDQIEATGYLGDVELRIASTRDLSSAMRQEEYEKLSYQEEVDRRKSVAEGKKPIEPVIVTVYKGNPQKTYDRLLSALGRDEMRELLAFMQVKQLK